ncbi:phage tail sheath family protein [Serratia ureilytica]|uniref:phage tail sheath family protein n=1 Tax=Serratia ureilytica TaxID=300181 RepID=UPI00313A79F7
MSEAYKVPGVYVEEIHGASLSIQSGETAVPVFVGIFNAIKTPTEELGEWPCVRVESWLDFTQQFASSDHIEIKLAETVSKSKINFVPYMGSHSVRLYFENGGGPCYILAIDVDKERARSAVSSHLLSAIERHPEITLLCWCEYAGKKDDQLVYSALSAGGGTNGERFLLADAWPQGKSELPSAWKFETYQVPDHTQVASYFPALRTQYVRDYRDENSVRISSVKKHLTALGLPGSHDIITLAALRSAIAKANAKGNNVPKTDLKNTASPQNIAPKVSEASSAVDVHIQTRDTFLQQVEMLIDLHRPAPSPVVLRASVAMAGVYARVDRERGVWKAPANIAVTGVTALVAQGEEGEGRWKHPVPVRMDDALNTKLVDAGINALRPFRGQGILVWGARTMAPAVQTAWRYVPVRRLFNTIERDARAALRTVVFEPNSPVVWEQVRGALNNYLHALWRKGALQGEAPEQAYYVHIGLGVTMSQDDIDQGRMVVKVGVAAVRPAEFIVLTLTQNVIAG